MVLLTMLGAVVGVPAGFAIDRVSERLSLEWVHEPDPSSSAAHAEPPENAASSETANAAATLATDGAGAKCSTGEGLPTPAAPEERKVLTWTAGLDGHAWLRRALIIAAAAAGCGAAFHRYSDPPGDAIIVCLYIAALLICTETDILIGRIADVVSIPAIGFALAIGSTYGDADVRDVLLGGAISGGLMLAMVPLKGGWGDTKLGLFIGLALGVRFTIGALLVMALAGGLYSFAVFLVTVLRGWRAPRSSMRRALKTPVPYGPAIALGAIAIMLTYGSAFREL